MRGSQYAAASRLNRWRLWNTGSSAFADETAESDRTQLRPLAVCARVMLRSFAPRKSEGAGNAGCALHPRSRVQSAQRKTHTSIQVSGGTSASPAQWLYGLYRALPGDEFVLSPSSAD